MARKRVIAEPGLSVAGLGLAREQRRRPRVSPAPEATPSAEHTPQGEEIARLAYSYWEARAFQGGSAEEDWHRAERELRTRPATFRATR